MDLCDKALFILDYGGYLTRKLFPTIDVFFKQDYTPLDNHTKNFFSNKSGLVILRQFSAFDGKITLFSVNSGEIYNQTSEKTKLLERRNY
jgi:hypothetical protein